MKSNYYILFFVLFFISCSLDSDEPLPVNEVKDLEMIQTLENGSHLVELYTESGQLEEGYNEIFLRLRNKEEQAYSDDAKFEWVPVMRMQDMQHSAPHSGVTRVPGTESLYSGFIIFQMSGNGSDAWDLSLGISVAGEEFSLTEGIEVLPSARKRVTVFTGSDASRYVLAMVAPTTPEVATNDLKMALYRMEGMMEFSVVNDHSIRMDPRMPAMGNHGSPNNVNLSQVPGDIFYTGKLNLTMTGLWRIHMQLLNQAGEVIKGEPVSETNDSSSLFLELEF